LTAITLLSVLGSALAAVFAGLLADFDSVFLFVTGAFGFSVAGFASALDEDCALNDAALAVVFGAALATAWAGALVGGLALSTGIAAAVFFTAGFAIDLLVTGLVAADFAFFAARVDFAGLFIAFAMESIPTGLLFLQRPNSAHVELIKMPTLTGLGFARAMFLEFSRPSCGIHFAKRITLRP
jgi:hypothetical protein